MSPPPPDSYEWDDRERSSPPIDAMLKLLADPLRRDVIECCASSSDRIHDTGELVGTIANAREDIGEDVDRDQLLLTLHHQHLPVLAESGMIDFDPRGGQLRYNPDEDVEEVLRHVRTEEAE